MKNIERIKLATLAGGAVQELFDNDLEKVIDNIADPNTSDKVARKLTIEFKFLPAGDRELVGLEIKTKTTLAPVEGTKTKMVIGKDGNVLIAAEYNNQIKGQVKIDEETGEILEDNNPFKENTLQFKAR